MKNFILGVIASIVASILFFVAQNAYGTWHSAREKVVLYHVDDNKIRIDDENLKTLKLVKSGNEFSTIKLKNSGSSDIKGAQFKISSIIAPGPEDFIGFGFIGGLGDDVDPPIVSRVGNDLFVNIPMFRKNKELSV